MYIVTSKCLTIEIAVIKFFIDCHARASFARPTSRRCFKVFVSNTVVYC